MLYILHGEDTVSSRKKMSELLAGKLNVSRLDGKKASVGEIEMATISDNMFADGQTVVIEQFSKIKSNEKLTEILSQAQKDENLDIVLWDEADLSAKIRSFKSAKIFLFTFPKVYFKFMDNLLPNSSPLTLKTLREVLQTYEAEQILYSIIKRLRQLLILKSDNYHEFSEFSKMQDWQLSKLRQQASKWSEAELKNAFIEYTLLDEKIKTGGLTMDLASHLDILIAHDLN